MTSRRNPTLADVSSCCLGTLEKHWSSQSLSIPTSTSSEQLVTHLLATYGHFVQSLRCRRQYTVALSVSRGEDVRRSTFLIVLDFPLPLTHRESPLLSAATRTLRHTPRPGRLGSSEAYFSLESLLEAIAADTEGNEFRLYCHETFGISLYLLTKICFSLAYERAVRLQALAGRISCYSAPLGVLLSTVRTNCKIPRPNATLCGPSGGTALPHTPASTAILSRSTACHCQLSSSPPAPTPRSASPAQPTCLHVPQLLQCSRCHGAGRTHARAPHDGCSDLAVTADVSPVAETKIVECSGGALGSPLGLLIASGYTYLFVFFPGKYCNVIPRFLHNIHTNTKSSQTSTIHTKKSEHAVYYHHYFQPA